MASLDVDSLSANMPLLDKTIEICVNELFKSSQTVSGLNKQHVLEILLLSTNENVILFDQKYYSQIEEVAMCSPLSPTLANIFLCHHKTTWLKNEILRSSKSFKPVYHKRFIDDIFVLIEKPEPFLQFFNYLNKNIKFSFETEKDISFSSLVLRFIEKKLNLQQIFSEKIRSVVYTLILVVWWHLNTDLA